MTRPVAARIDSTLEEVREETLDLGDLYGAFDALNILPPRIRRERDPSRRIALRSRLSCCAFMVMDYDIAIHEARVALRALVRLTDRPTHAEAWLRTTLGSSYSRTGRTEDAVRELQRAVELYGVVGDHESQLEALAELAEAFVDSGEDDLALNVLEECLRHLRGPWARDAAEQVARIARRRGDLDAEIDALVVARAEGLGSGSEIEDHLGALTASTTELVEVLLERGRPRDLRQAVSLLDDSMGRLSQLASTDADDLRSLRDLRRAARRRLP